MWSPRSSAQLIARTAAPILLALPVGACGLLVQDRQTTKKPASEKRRSIDVEMPWTTEARDNPKAPVLQVRLYDDGVEGVAVPYIYGYPLYAGGGAVRGILKLRHDNAEGASRDELEDSHGVVRRVEHLPQIGCSIEGIEQSQTEFVPLFLRCELPPPERLGGAQRPVLGDLHAGAPPARVMAEPSLAEAFYGDWHMVDGDLNSRGEGVFNTEHGQLAFGFDEGGLSHLKYYFDPPEKRWRSAMLWSDP